MAATKSAQREVMESMYSVIALIFILVTCVELGDAATAVDVYRLIQYDISGVPFGSRLSRLSHHAASMDFAAELDFKARMGFRLPTDSDLSRTVLVLPLRDLSVNFVKGYVSEGRPLGGLLFLLPPILSFEDKEGNGGSSQPSDAELFESSLVKRLERLLIDTNIPYPVYFAFEDHNVKAVLADIKRTNETLQLPTATTGGYKLVVSVSEPKKVASPIITNIQGWLPGLKAEGDSSQLPTIAIVASYDTFGAAPALSVGSDSNGSGVVALLELARLFSLLYSNPKTRGRYNLLFGLTSGGPYNYDGTSKWLRNFDHRLRESIDYAICLNSVGSGNNELFLHVSKPPENAYIKQIFEGLSSVAGDLDIKVGLKHKKINISDSRVAWEHEQFSRLRITAATLSDLSTAPRLLESTGGLSDVRHFTSETAVVKSVKLVAESLATHIYGHEGKNIQIFADNSSLAVNPCYIRTWMDVLSRTPRVAPFLAKKDPLVMALKKELADHTDEATLQTEVLDEMFTFYDSTKAKLNIYQVASVSFDFLLLLALGSYLIVLFSFLVITTRGVDDLISIFRRPPTRKAKSA